jgi:hypothetical protein
MLSMGNLRGKELFLKGEFRFRSQFFVMSAGCMRGCGLGREERGVERWSW